MKPKFLALPRHLVLASSAVMAVLAPLNTFAVDYTWGGVTDSTWTDNANWTTGTAPVYGTSYLSDTLRISNGAASTAVYNPGSALTTTFGSGRAFILGSTSAGSLTVSSGTIAAVRATVGGNEPLMANNANASLLINGGAVDLTAHLNTFQFLNSGAANTSNLTISSGSFSSNGFNLQTAGTGAGTINLDGGSMAVTAFTRTATGGSSILNLNGGTLQIRSASSASFLPDLVGLQTIVKAGGAIIDSNSLSLTIAEVLEHDSTLGLSADGGLTKNGAGTLTLSGTNTFTGPVTVNAGTSITPSRILLSNDSAAGSGAITLADSYADIQVNNTRNITNAITVSDTGTDKTLLLPAAGAVSAEISGPITINETTLGEFRLRSDSSCALTLSGKISGVGGTLTKIQSGDVYLTNAANEFTGGTRIDAGKLQYVYGALGASGNVTMNGGSLRWMPGNIQDLSARLVMVNAKTATYETGGNNITFGTAIGNSSTANLAKTGSGTLTLTGTNSYTGTTTVNGGTLRVDGSLDAASAVSVTAGELAGIGTIGGSVTVATAGNIVPRAVGFAGTLTMGGGLDVAAMAAGTGKLKFDLGANTAASDQISVTGGTLAIGTAVLGFSDFTFNDLAGGPQNVAYTLITSSAPISGTLNGSDLSGTIGVGGTGTLSVSDNDIVLTVTGLSVPGYAAWQAANSTAGGLNEDHDADGVDNGTEYFLFGNASSTGFTALPGVNGNSVTWTKAATGYDGAYNTDFFVETSDTLAAGSWVTAAEGTGADKVEITGNNVKYTFPTGTKNFARLKVTGP